MKEITTVKTVEEKKYIAKMVVYYVLEPTNQFSITLSKNDEEGYYWGDGITKDTIVTEDRVALCNHLCAMYMQMSRGNGVGRPDRCWSMEVRFLTENIEFTPVKEQEDGTYVEDPWDNVFDFIINSGFEPVYTWIVQTEANPEIYLVIDEPSNGLFSNEPQPYLSNDKSKRIIFDNPLAAADYKDGYEGKFGVNLIFTPEIRLNKMPK